MKSSDLETLNLSWQDETNIKEYILLKNHEYHITIIDNGHLQW